MEYIMLFISSSLVNNFILIRFLGICPFMGVSRSINVSVSISLAIMFVMTASSSATWLVYRLVLVPLGIQFMQTVVFILIIASLVQFVEMAIEKTSPQMHVALGIYLPLIATNCAVLGIALINAQDNRGFLEMLVFTIGSAAGMGVAQVLFAGIRERVSFSDVPQAFKGMPIAFISAGILAIAFMGFAGLVK
ncbi:Na+-translocating ferredoxin:NAD+ oxidoreductase RNF, RnfA subunit [Deferribacterales bacterium RsTz2092]|nr:electron transport complex subunit A [Deferribacterales bacterium]